MVPSVHGAPFAVPLGSSQESGERGEAEGRQADTQIVARAVLLRMLAALRDRSMSRNATCVIARCYCAKAAQESHALFGNGLDATGCSPVKIDKIT